MSIKKSIVVAVIAVLMVQCKKEDRNTIAKGQLGMLTAATQVNELEALFEADSLVANLGEGDFANAEYDEYLVYEQTNLW